MPEKTPRMRLIEEQLAEDPSDAFLRYGLAMEYVSIGDDETAVRLFRELIQDQAYVPAFLMAGQALIRLARDAEAVEILRQGIAAAQAQGNIHALGEMQGLLSSIE